MKGERELDKFLSETPDITCNNNNHHYHQQMLKGVAAVSSGFCFSDVGSSSIPPFDHSQNPSPQTHFVDQISVPDSWCGNGMMDELLARKFHLMSIGNRTEFCSDIGRLGRDRELFRISDCNVPKNFGSSEGGFPGNAELLSPIYRDERNTQDGVHFRFGHGGDNITMGDSLESIPAQNHSSLPYSYSGYGNRNCSINFPFEESCLPRYDSYGNLGGNKCYDDGTLINRSNDHLIRDHTGNGGGDGGYSHIIPLQVRSMCAPLVGGDQGVLDGCKQVLNPWACSQNLSMYRTYSGEPGMHYMGGVNGIMDSSQLIHSKQALTRGNKLYNFMGEKMRGAEEREVMKKGRHLDIYGRESGFIAKEKELGAAFGRVKNPLAGTTMQTFGDRSLELNDQMHSGTACGITCDPAFLQSIYNSVAELQGNIYAMAKDQHGCRFLQKKFDKGSFDDVQLIFDEIIDHVVELMMNPFGNYLIQKLLDVCNEEQRMRIVHTVTKDRGVLGKICLNTHGTRVVQKLIESLKTKKQISLIIRALEPGFLDLIKDLNGNHVVQRCLQCLSSEDNKFIFDAAAKFCVEIATHRHGCCVLQRCISHSSGEHQKKLVEEICRNGLHLAQDPFGNYVVQYIIELKFGAAATQLTSQFEGHYVQLSTQKFSSHVVEKCLKFIEESRSRIVYELLLASHFDQLLQDPYANYVIQSALEVTKGPLNESLVAAVRPHSMLRTNPYCKKIFSRGLLKK